MCLIYSSWANSFKHACSSHALASTDVYHTQTLTSTLAAKLMNLLFHVIFLPGRVEAYFFSIAFLARAADNNIARLCHLVEKKKRPTYNNK